MNYSTAALIFTFAITSPALAKDKRDKPPRTPSSVERQDKTYTVDGQPLTLFVGSVGQGFTQGASFGAYLTPDSVLRGTLRGGKSCLEERCSYVEASAGLSLQKFVLNSLFVEFGGALQRNIYHPVDSDYSSHDARKYHFTYTAETLSATFALGNQWQWQSFTLGVRWVALSQAVFSRSGKIHADAPEKYQTAHAEKQQLEKLETEFKFYLPSIALGLSF